MGLFFCLFELSLKYLSATNRIAVGLLVEQGWQAKRAYPVYGT